MNMKNLKSKLSSRKFWALVSALVISILALFNCPQESVVGSVELLVVSSVYSDSITTGFALS